MWAITSYFNPLGNRFRRRNFDAFRRSLGMPLIAIELSDSGRFELDSECAERIVRVTCSDLLWQKERLLNIALNELPATCGVVAWIDCDVLFSGKSWQQKAIDQLARFPVVQLFEQVCHLNPKDIEPRPSSTHGFEFGIASQVTDGRTFTESMSTWTIRGRCSIVSGMAWASRREILAEHGLFDMSVFGGGDSAFAGAVYGEYDSVATMHALNARQLDSYLRWARPLYEAVRGNVSFLDESIFHLYHGKLGQRMAWERHRLLSDAGFDPRSDISIDPSGAWRWTGRNPRIQ